jgi:S1-C subfamily serine protease
MLKHSLALVIVLSLPASAAATQQRKPVPQQSQPSRPPVPVKDLTASELFAKTRNAIVTVETPTGFGSGVVVDSSGLVVTNLHVIADDSSAVVTLSNGDTYDSVTVAAVDARRDLALLRIAGFGLPIADLGNSDTAQVGDKVYALGAPEGLKLSLSDGIVSAIRDSEEGGYKVLQTTAAISPGSSGGGLFNQRGQLLGITSFKIRGGENLNFAVPVNYVRGLIGSPGTPMSLSEVHAKYGTTKPTAAKAREPATAAAVPSPRTPPATVPRLFVSYRSGTTGAAMLVSQTSASAAITIYNNSYMVIGHAAVTWDERLKRFWGKAEVTYVCGTFDTRTTVVTSDIEYYYDVGGVLREVYQRPTGLNCSAGQVKGWDVGYDRWWPGQ